MEISYEKTLKIEVLEEFASELIGIIIRKECKEGDTAEGNTLLKRLHYIKDEMYACNFDKLLEYEKELKKTRDELKVMYGEDA